MGKKKVGKVIYRGLRPLSELRSTPMASIVFGKNLNTPSTNDDWLSSKPPVADEDLPERKLEVSKKL